MLLQGLSGISRKKLRYTSGTSGVRSSIVALLIIVNEKLGKVVSIGAGHDVGVQYNLSGTTLDMAIKSLSLWRSIKSCSIVSLQTSDCHRSLNL
jgi:hypothetical protein